MQDLRLMIYRKMMWKRHQIRTEANRESHELRYLFFEVTRRCNIACRYCGSECTPKIRENELPTEKWLRIIDEVAEDFNPRRIMVAVTGGEPLTRDGIYEIFGHLHEKGFRYGMVCNSTLLDAEAAKKIVACGMNSISLSIDSIEAVNDKVRAKGCTAAFLSAVGNLRSAGYNGILEALSTITKPCLPHLEEMQKWLTSIGIKRWRVSPVIPIGRAAECPDLCLSDEEVCRLLDFVRGRRMTESDMRLEFSEEGYLGDDYEGLVRPYLCQCRAGINIAGIRYDGKIGACPEISPVFDQGDIKTERLSDVWRDRFQNMRDRSWMHRLGPCARCDKHSVCGGGALHLYDDMQTPTRRCFYRMIERTKHES